MLQELSCARAISDCKRKDHKRPSSRTREGDSAEVEQLYQRYILVNRPQQLPSLSIMTPALCYFCLGSSRPLTFSMLIAIYPHHLDVILPVNRNECVMLKDVTPLFAASTARPSLLSRSRRSHQFLGTTSIESHTAFCMPGMFVMLQSRESVLSKSLRTTSNPILTRRLSHIHHCG